MQKGKVIPVYNRWWCPFNESPIFDNIDPYQFSKPIKLLSEYYNTVEYLKELYNKIPKRWKKEPINVSTDQDLNTMIMYYALCLKYGSLFVFEGDIDLDPLFKKISNFGNVYAYKQLSVSERERTNLEYQLSGCTKINKHYVGKSTQITVVLIGSEKLINEWLKNEKTTFYCTKSQSDLYRLSKLFFCENSLKLLRYQNIENIGSKTFHSCANKVNTLKKWIQQNITTLDQCRFLIFSSVVMFVYGIRYCLDIDGTILHVPYRKEMFDKIDKAFYTDYFPFEVEMTYEGCPIWKDKWIEKNQKMAEYLGTKSWIEVNFNPKYHFYFMGMKLLDIDSEVKLKQTIKRDKFKPYVDIYLLKEAGFDYDFPKVPRYTFRENTPIDPDSFYNVIKILLKRRANKEISVDQLKKYIQFE